MGNFVFKFLVIILMFIPLSNANDNEINFFAGESMVSVSLSPNGRSVVAVTHKEKQQQLVLIDTKTLSKQVLLDLAEYTSEDSSVGGIEWIDDRHIGAQFIEVKKGIKDLMDTKLARTLLVIKLPEAHQHEVDILSVRTNGWMVHSLPNRPNKFLYAKSGIYSKVYEIDVRKLSPHKKKLGKLSKIDGGQFTGKNTVASVKGYATRWFISPEGVPSAVMNFGDENALILNIFDAKKEAIELKRWSRSELNDESLDRRILPVAISEEKNTFYCLDFLEEEERSVYKVDYVTGKESLEYESDSFKIIDLIFSNSGNELAGVKVINNGDVKNVYIDGRIQEGFRDKRLKIDYESKIGESTDRDIALFYSEGHSQPGTYYLQVEDGRKKLIGHVYPQIYGRLSSRLEDGVVNVEGLDIPYLLTLPKSDKTKDFPLIVMPHGGPIGVFDHRYFDLTTQYFAANGFAVLRVNFRGSSGYSEKLKEAGKKQWGNLILEDIYRATVDVVGRPDIDRSRVAVLGMSYGGYAATMLVIKYPELYQSGVNIAGVSDLSLYVSGSGVSKRQYRWLKEYVGDNVLEYERLKSISPVYLTEELRKPLLIMHGAKDTVVDVEHAYRLKLALEKYDKKFSWHIFPEGVHSFSSSGEAEELFSKASEFIRGSLGGE